MKHCAKCLETKPDSSFGLLKKGEPSLRSWCRDCSNKYGASYRKNNSQKISQQKKEWLEKQPDEYFENKRAIFKNRHPDYKKLESAKRRLDNPEKIRKYNREWNRKNSHKLPAILKASRVKKPGLYASLTAKRRALQKMSIPAWADLEKIKEYYDTAHGMDMLLGEFHHVDHKVPLQSDIVCGLHCENNLQILKAKDNIKKGNRYWEDMP